MIKIKLRQPLIFTRTLFATPSHLVHIQGGRTTYLWPRKPLSEPQNNQQHPQNRPIFRGPKFLPRPNFATLFPLIFIQESNATHLWPHKLPSEPQSN